AARQRHGGGHGASAMQCAVASAQLATGYSERAPHRALVCRSTPNGTAWSGCVFVLTMPRAACPCKQRRRDVLREATRRERCQCSVKRSARRLLCPAERICAHWSRAAGQDCVRCARSRRAVVGVAGAGYVGQRKITEVFAAMQAFKVGGSCF
ncbi:MAG: hypothetical protein ACPIOQ_38145, partial [Promethearchaeia archaeon]